MSTTQPKQSDIGITSQPTKRTGGIEAHSIDYIPEEERHGSAWRQGPFWFVANFGIFSVALGFIGPGLGLSLGATILAGALGTLFGGFFLSFHASQGPKLGLPQMIQSRAQFGYKGALVPIVAVLFNFMVFNVLFAQVMETGLNGIYGWNSVLVVIGVSVLAAVLAIYGHDWIHRVFAILFWAMIPFTLILTIGMMTGHAGGGQPVASTFSLSAFVAVFAAAASYQITLAPDVSDYTRYLPTHTKTSHIVAIVQIGSSLSLIWLLAMGAWLASRAGATDALVAINQSGNYMFTGLGTALSVISVLALISTMSINTYSATLAVVTIIDCFRPVATTRRLRVIVTLALFVIWVLVTLNVGSDQSTLINNMLIILLYILVPWTSVNLTDYFFVRKGHYAITEIFDRNGIYGVWAWRGLMAYFVALLAEVPFMVLSFYKGPLASFVGGIDIAFVVGLIVPAVLYLIFSRSLHLASESAVIAESDKLLAQGAEPEDPEFRAAHGMA